MKRPRPARQIRNRIAVKWGIAIEGEDLYVSWGPGTRKADANMIVSEVNQLAQKLQARGYDITTVKFEIWAPKGGVQDGNQP